MQYGSPLQLFRQGIPPRVKFSALALAATALILVDSSMHLLDPVRAGVRAFLSPVQSLLDLPPSLISGARSWLVDKEALLAENTRLSLELEEARMAARQSAETLEQNIQLRALLGLRGQQPSNTWLMVEITGESGDRFFRHMMLDQGAAAGVKLGQAVIAADGLVGQVSRVYPDVSEVTLITSRSVQVPVQVERTGLRGIAEGNGETHAMHMIYVPADADIATGDSIVTSGIDGVFPRGTPVGAVSSVERVSGETFARVSVEPASKLRAVRFARICLGIEDPRREEAAETAPARKARASGRQKLRSGRR